MERVHFMGIGGVGMAGLAFLMHAEDGTAVSGCDRAASPRTRWLEAHGIPVAIGHDAAHLAQADALVITPAVPPDAPERRAAEAARLSVRRRGDVLAARVNARFGIAVCGTHGKTTTATFTAKLLHALGADPAWCIGGETGDFPVAGTGAGPLVVEADESDGTLAHYRAKILVVMNMDWDHPDHFPTEASYRACYAEAMARAETVIRAWELDASDYPELPALVAGAHNVTNARAAIAVALQLGYAPAAIRAALPEVLSALPDRRFERLYPSPVQSPKSQVPSPFSVYTDYAHHPRELACAVAMARACAPQRLRVLFQPHRYSRTKVLGEQFPAAFAGADEVILIPVYAAFEEPLAGGDIADLYAAFRRQETPDGPKTYLARSAREAWRHVFLTRRAGDLVLLAGAGDIIRLADDVARDLAPGAPARPRARIPLGAGSNTWRSDLATDEDYVRTSGPAGRPGATLNIPWMAGIPGTIGGWVKMNAGAFGHAIGECVARVKADGRWIEAADCGFAYRHSDIAGEIEDVAFDFSHADFPDPSDPANKHALDALAATYRARRRAFPPGTKGSVFKNPSPDLPAGRLLEEAGAKALRVGGAAVWQEHANVIVSGPGARASDFLALARLMARAVYFKTGLRLEPEVCDLTVWP